MRIRPQLASLLCVITIGLSGLAARAQSGETATVTGHVYCADTQKPARFANVVLRPIDLQSGRGAGGSGFATTGPDGSFRITGVAPGDYYAEVRMPGYLQPLRATGRDVLELTPADRDRLNALLTRVTVTAGQTATVQVTIYRGATISGTVSYDDGSPAPGMRIAPLALPTGTNGFGISAQTDDRGQFRLTGLDEGTFTIFAEPRSSFPVYYGNTIERSSAKKLELHTGDEVSGADIQIPAAGMHRVSGFVVSQPDGLPVPHVALQMRLRSGDPAGLLTAFTAADGSFTFNAVPDGKFNVQVTGTSGDAGGGGQALDLHGGDVTDLIVNTTARN
ncbi:MAG: hypothetical protein JWM54_1446 [Acidobacteriaceae bacterium]|nr:hypothetical protein [Acidobacteriaceae bacterium]